MDWAGATEEYSCPGPRWQVEVGPTGREGFGKGSQPERPTLLLSFTRRVFRTTAFREACAANKPPLPSTLVVLWSARWGRSRGRERSGLPLTNFLFGELDALFRQFPNPRSNPAGDLPPRVGQVQVGRHQRQVGRGWPDTEDGVVKGDVLHEDAVEGAVLGVRLEAERLGHVGLCVAVQGQDRRLAGQDRGQRHGGGRLADPALLVGDRDDARALADALRGEALRPEAGGQLAAFTMR